MPPAPRSISVVVPVFNSEVLPELVQRLTAVFAALGQADYEILLVDDGSSSTKTWADLAALAEEYPRAVALQLTRNFGQQPATLCGLAHSRGDVVITLDDDLQHAPEDIPALLAAADCDIVIGQFDRSRHPPLRRLASRCKGWFDQILIGKPAGIQLSSYRLLSRAVVNGVLAGRTPRPFLPAMMFNVSRQVKGVPVTHHPRTVGRSGYGLRKLLSLFSNLLINNSSVLLRWVGHLGIGLAGVSVLLSLVVVYRRLVHAIKLPGWASLSAALLMLGGIILFALGVIGEYLARIVEAVENRPTYVVRRRVGGRPGPPGGP